MGLQYFIMPAIFNVHEFIIMCNTFHDFRSSRKFWRVKLKQNKDCFAKFAKVLHHQCFPLCGSSTRRQEPSYELLYNYKAQNKVCNQQQKLMNKDIDK